mgnify:CR=1 FL=1
MCECVGVFCHQKDSMYSCHLCFYVCVVCTQTHITTIVDCRSFGSGYETVPVCLVPRPSFAAVDRLQQSALEKTRAFAAGQMVAIP